MTHSITPLPPCPYTPTDREAAELRLSRQLRRLELAETAARFVPAELDALRRRLFAQQDTIAAIERRLREIETELEAARAEAAGEIETVCCNCHTHLRGPEGAPKVSHGLCERCERELTAALT